MVTTSVTIPFCSVVGTGGAGGHGCGSDSGGHGGSLRLPRLRLSCVGEPDCDSGGKPGGESPRPQLGSFWERSCRHFLSDHELRADPLQGTLQRAIDRSTVKVREGWWETPRGAADWKAAPFQATQLLTTEFNELRRVLLHASSVNGLALLATPEFQVNLGVDEQATADLFHQFLLTNRELHIRPSVAFFVATELPEAFTREFTAELFSREPGAEVVRFAFDRLTQRMQLTLLIESAATAEQRSRAPQELAEELARLQALDREEREERIVAPLQELIRHQRETLEEVHRLADAFNAAQAAKARVIPVADLRWGITGPRVDIRVPAWHPSQEQVLPWERDAARILSENRALVIRGKASSGKTHLAGNLMQATPDALVVIPQSFSEAPPPFTDLANRDVILFLDDFHERARTFDPLPWWAALEDVCGPDATRLLVTARAGDYWEEVQDHRQAFLDSLPRGSVFEIPELDGAAGLQLGRWLGLSKLEQRRFDGTIGSLILDISEMGDAYRRLTREVNDGVASSRLLDAAKLLHSVRQPALREDVLQRVCEEVLGGGQPMSRERWRFLKERTASQGFGRFDGGLFITYAPYLERPDVIETFVPASGDVEAVAPLILACSDTEAVFYLGISAEFDWRLVELAKTAYQRGMALGNGGAASNFGALLKKAGDLEGAERAYRTGMALGDGAAARNLGLLLYQRGDLKGAEATWRTGTELGNGGAAHNLGWLLEQRGDLEEAEVAYNKGMELGRSESALNLGLLLKERGDLEGAKRAWRTGLELAHGKTAHYLGMLLEAIGDADGAKQAYQRAKELGPGE